MPITTVDGAFFPETPFATAPFRSAQTSEQQQQSQQTVEAQAIPLSALKLTTSVVACDGSVFLAVKLDTNKCLQAKDFPQQAPDLNNMVNTVFNNLRQSEARVVQPSRLEITGSYAKGTAVESSDRDIAAIYDRQQFSTASKFIREHDKLLDDIVTVMQQDGYQCRKQRHSVAVRDILLGVTYDIVPYYDGPITAEEADDDRLAPSYGFDRVRYINSIAKANPAILGAIRVVKTAMREYSKFFTNIEDLKGYYAELFVTNAYLSQVDETRLQPMTVGDMLHITAQHMKSAGAEITDPVTMKHTYMNKEDFELLFHLVRVMGGLCK